MNIAAIVFGSVMLLSGTLFVLTLCHPPGRPNGPQVGDVYGHVNHGTSDFDPRQPPHPWAGVYVVKEITGDRVRVAWQATDVSGQQRNYEAWYELERLARFDTRLFKAPPAAEKP